MSDMVFIDGLSLPTKCSSCQFLEMSQGYCLAYKNGRERKVPFENEDKRQKWCPLREVSEFRFVVYDENGHTILDQRSEEYDIS